MIKTRRKKLLNDDHAVHFMGVDRNDLLVVAYHDGRAYSVAVQNCGFNGISTPIVAELSRRARRGEQAFHDLAGPAGDQLQLGLW